MANEKNKNWKITQELVNKIKEAKTRDEIVTAVDEHLKRSDRNLLIESLTEIDSQLKKVRTQIEYMQSYINESDMEIIDLRESAKHMLQVLEEIHRKEIGEII